MPFFEKSFTTEFNLTELGVYLIVWRTEPHESFLSCFYNKWYNIKKNTDTTFHYVDEKIYYDYKTVFFVYINWSRFTNILLSRQTLLLVVVTRWPRFKLLVGFKNWMLYSKHRFINFQARARLGRNCLIVCTAIAEIILLFSMLLSRISDEIV